MKPPPPAIAWPAALRLGVVLCAAELVLTRITGGERVAPVTVASAVGAALLLAGVPGALLDLLPQPPRLRYALHSLFGWGLCALIGLGIVGPVVLEVSGRGAALAAGLALLGLIAALSLSFRGAVHSPYPRPIVVLGFLTLAAVAGWLVGPGTLPAVATLVALAISGVAIAALASTSKGVAPAGILGVLIALVPTFPGRIDWADRPAGDGPDIVIVSVDALRYDAAQEMLTYQKLAANGVEFRSAVSPAPWTLPSVATLLTGVPPGLHGAGARTGGAYTGVAPAAPALAERLAARGYDTVGLIAPNPFVGASFGLDRGFDSFYQPGWSSHALPRGLQNLAACPLLVRAAEKELKLILCRSIDGEGLTDTALQVVAQRRERPLFIWVHYLDVHLPYVHTTSPSVSADTRRMVAGDFRKELETLDGRPGLRAEIVAANRDEVRFVDGQVERLLGALGDAPSRGRVVVLTADHGEELFEHGGFEHGHALIDEVIHIPLVISGLARPPGVEDAPVTLMDVTATLLASAGGQEPAMKGANLALPLPTDRPLRTGNMLRVAADRMFAIRRGWWKAISDTEAADALFDLQHDPGEVHNLAAVHPETFAALVLGQPRESLPSGVEVEVNDEEKARLEALGYAVPSD